MELSELWFNCQLLQDLFYIVHFKYSQSKLINTIIHFILALCRFCSTFISRTHCRDVERSVSKQWRDKWSECIFCSFSTYRLTLCIRLQQAAVGRAAVLDGGRKSSQSQAPGWGVQLLLLNTWGHRHNMWRQILIIPKYVEQHLP